MPAESGPSGDAVRPRRRRKKKKARSERGAQRIGAPEHIAAPAGERPAFAAAYPRDPDVERLLQAFEAGNFAYVRAEAPGVIERAADDDVREAARDLRRRIDADPTSMFLWALGVALLVFLYGYYLAR